MIKLENTLKQEILEKLEKSKIEKEKAVINVSLIEETIKVPEKLLIYKLVATARYELISDYRTYTYCKLNGNKITNELIDRIKLNEEFILLHIWFKMAIANTGITPREYLNAIRELTGYNALIELIRLSK